MFLSVILICSCQTGTFEDPTPRLGIDIPESLVPHFQSFQKEAEAQGTVIDYVDASVSAEMTTINQGSVAGTCTTNGHDLRHIVIDQKFWNRASHLTREMIVYHELGHCILGRGHREDSFSNGACKSIMRSGTGSCLDAYTVANRDYFVAELFAVD